MLHRIPEKWAGDDATEVLISGWLLPQDLLFQSVERCASGSRFCSFSSKVETVRWGRQGPQLRLQAGAFSASGNVA